METLLKNTNEVKNQIEQMNGRVLRRLFPEMNEILIHGKSSVVYEFDVFAKVWHELQMKGSFFLIRTSKKTESLAIVVLNRCNPEDFIYKLSLEDLVEFDSSYKFITIKATKEGSRIVGVWLSEMEDYQKAKEIMMRYLQKIKNEEKH